MTASMMYFIVFNMREAFIHVMSWSWHKQIFCIFMVFQYNEVAAFRNIVCFFCSRSTCMFCSNDDINEFNVYFGMRIQWGHCIHRIFFCYFARSSCTYDITITIFTNFMYFRFFNFAMIVNIFVIFINVQINVILYCLYQLFVCILLYLWTKIFIHIR